MNKAEEKRLHKDPRYKARRAAYVEMAEKLRAADDAALAAIREYYSGIGIEPSVSAKYSAGLSPPSDEALFDLLRPHGAKVRLVGKGISSTGEVASVTESSVIIGTGAKYDLVTGERYRVDRWTPDESIHPEDLARIKSGELKGWRQKKWGES